MQFDLKAKIFSDFDSFKKTLSEWRSQGEQIVFTNGCFDIIHHGHVDSLQKSAELGSKLIVGLNADQSVELLKGKNRPIFKVEARAIILAAFGFVDAVIIFCEDTPARLIEQIIPDVLVKGNQYKICEIVGHDTVLAHGGKVIALDMVDEVSTSEIIYKIKQLE
ncbi:MAG: D-glycero-beta-D-manno-heptose 1-phosphate adenylyltransferase [Draconibacterium sp.]|nr:MAG: D-glycero-beta-D-manno-heptose 1-phosphate adenylyltransferase [Draconibacterium sp.]